MLRDFFLLLLYSPVVLEMDCSRKLHNITSHIPYKPIYYAA